MKQKGQNINQRKSVIIFFDGFASVICEANSRTIHGERIKILTPKQIPINFQLKIAIRQIPRLPIYCISKSS